LNYPGLFLQSVHKENNGTGTYHYSPYELTAKINLDNSTHYFNASLGNNLTDLFILNIQGDNSVYPQFKDALYSIANGNEYDPQKSYNFSITITDTNGSAGIEFNGTNYSLFNVSKVYTKTFSTLGAGTYYYYFWGYGNGSSHLFDNSQVNNYTIVKNTSAMVYTYLNNVRSNLTIYNNTSIWLNGTLFNMNASLFLYKNGNLINENLPANVPITLSNYTRFSSIGQYNITSIYNGNDNYSGKSETWFVNVISLPRCGDSICNGNETCTSCSIDCRVCDNQNSQNNGEGNTATGRNSNNTNPNSGIMNDGNEGTEESKSDQGNTTLENPESNNVLSSIKKNKNFLGIPPAVIYYIIIGIIVVAIIITIIMFFKKKIPNLSAP
jgi:hypothetical protein